MLNLAPANPQSYKEVLKVASKQQPYFRTEEFESKIEKLQNNIKEIANAKNHEVKILTCSGTGTMDSVVNNFISKKDKILVIVGGRFGQRWIDIISYYKLKFDIFKVEYGKDIGLNKLNSVIKNTKYDFVLMQHNETESMQLFDIAEVGYCCKKYNTQLVVDACSSFGIDNIDMDRWNIDILLFGTQKGLNTNPGLGVIIYNSNLLIKKGNYYFDLKKYNDSLAYFILPFTPNLISIEQALIMTDKILRYGKEKWYNQIREKAEYFRNLIKDFPIEIVAQTLSNCGTVIKTYKEDYKDFFNYLCKKQIYICPSGGKMGQELTISHIGNITNKDLLFIAKELRKWLIK